MRIRALWMVLLAALAGGARAGTMACADSQATLDEACVGAAVEAALRERWAADGGRVEVRVEPLPRRIPVPAGLLDVEAQLAQGLAPRSRVPLRVRVASGGRAVASIVVWAQVQVWKTVMRTREALARDTVLRPEMLEPVELDVAQLTSAAYAEAPGRSRLRMALPAGIVLLQRHVTTLALVARDDHVRLRYRYGDIEIDTGAVATGDAALGGTVGVRPFAGGQTVRSVVVGPGSVAPKE